MADIEKGTNPAEPLVWQAPTENTDGTPVKGPLTYNLYRAGTEAALVKSPETLFMALPGQLNVDGRYEAPLPDFPEGRHVIALTAVDIEGDESELSNTVGFRIGVAPLAPVIVA